MNNYRIKISIFQFDKYIRKIRYELKLNNSRINNSKEIYDWDLKGNLNNVGSRYMGGFGCAGWAGGGSGNLTAYVVRYLCLYCKAYVN